MDHGQSSVHVRRSGQVAEHGIRIAPPSAGSLVPALDLLLIDIGWIFAGSITDPHQHAAIDWQADASDETGLVRCKEDGRIGDVPARAHPAA